MIGTTISRYKILSKLGGGGMGVVYEAEDTQLGRHVAIKFLPEGTASSPDALERFQREARAASALDHPHICTVFDVGSHEGQPFLVMERLKGQTLKHLIGPGGLPVDDVVRLGEQFADALDAAQQAGIVHRDLKPANLFVTERGDGKILDFGLAKVGTKTSGSAVDAAASTVAGEFLTEAGTTLGTVAYMSPEQAKGQTVDARSDIFSLGVVLYEMSTGRLPFPGESPAELFAAILGKEPAPPRELSPEIPARLEEIILKALEKDPAMRYQTAVGLRGDLLRLIRDASGASRRSSPAASAGSEKLSLMGTDSPGSRRGLWLGVGATAIVALAGVVYFATRGSSPGGVASAGEGAAGAAAPAAAVPEKSIAVLPFVNMSSDKEQEYFSDGISEELMNLLAKIPELQVTARTSSFSFKGKEVEIPEIARQLGVAHVLEGSVRKSGDQIRITAQLIHAADGFHLWSETYDRTLDDVFAIQDEIAGEVVKQLKLKLLGAAPKARTTDPQAYALYLRAVQLGRQLTAEAFEMSDALYREVLAIDPRYSPAWVQLIRNYLNQSQLGLLTSEEGYSRAREAAVKALAVDPDYAPVHARLGYVAMYGDRDFAGAARHFERALALDPNDLEVLGNAATLLDNLGRLDEALAVYEAVVRRDPVNVIVLFNLGIARLEAGQYDASIALFRETLSLSPEMGGARWSLGTSMLLQGDARGALAEIERDSSERWRRIGLPMAFHGLGRRADSDRALAELIEKDGTEAPTYVAAVHAYRGETNAAFEWLERARALRDPLLGEIVPNGFFEKLRTDPRWEPFLRQLGMASEQLAQIEFEVRLPK